MNTSILKISLSALLVLFWIAGSQVLAEDMLLPDRDPQLACELVKHEDALLLDVRSWWEYSLYRFPGAKNISVGDLSERLDEVTQALGGSKEKPIVVYCARGVRASTAKKILQEAGFSRVTNLGGISDWKDCD